MRSYLKKVFLYIHRQLYQNTKKIYSMPKIVYNSRSINLKSTKVSDINF